jgi:hypothetical protein
MQKVNVDIPELVFAAGLDTSNPSSGLRHILAKSLTPLGQGLPQYQQLDQVAHSIGSRSVPVTRWPDGAKLSRVLKGSRPDNGGQLYACRHMAANRESWRLRT